MRETFTRIEDNEEVNIEVSLDAKQHKDDCPWIFSVFIKFDTVDDELDTFFEVKESLIISLELDKKAFYAGNRIVGDWSEVYFYAPGSKQLDTITAKVLKPTGYIFESNVAKDKDWQFFDFNIFPTDLELAMMQSKMIVSHMVDEGDDISKSREVEHYASFDTPTQKEKFVLKAQAFGFTYKDDISSEEFDNGVAMLKNHSLEDEELYKSITTFVELIQEYNGEYELWSTVFV